MTIISPRQFFRRNQPPISPKHGNALAEALVAELQRQVMLDKTGGTTTKMLARNLIADPVGINQIMHKLGGNCTDPMCSAAFHAMLCRLAWS